MKPKQGVLSSDASKARDLVNIIKSTGLIVRTRRNPLEEGTINVVMSLKSWTKEGVIKWTDDKVKEVADSNAVEGVSDTESESNT